MFVNVHAYAAELHIDHRRNYVPLQFIGGVSVFCPKTLAKSRPKTVDDNGVGSSVCYLARREFLRTPIGPLEVLGHPNAKAGVGGIRQAPVVHPEQQARCLHRAFRLNREGAPVMPKKGEVERSVVENAIALKDAATHFRSDGRPSKYKTFLAAGVELQRSDFGAIGV
jgi:hypothetical protein